MLCGVILYVYLFCEMGSKFIVYGHHILNAVPLEHSSELL